MKLTDEQCELIWREAMVAARRATEETINQNPGVWYPCGFAWCVIKPANSRFANYLKKAGYASTNNYSSGLTIWNPSNNVTQWMDAKTAGAEAFAKVLTSYGINCTAYERMD